MIELNYRISVYKISNRLVAAAQFFRLEIEHRSNTWCNQSGHKFSMRRNNIHSSRCPKINGYEELIYLKAIFPSLPISKAPFAEQLYPSQRIGVS